MRYKDPRSTLPISPANWDALKRNIPGLEAAAQNLQRDPVPTKTSGFREVKIIDITANYEDSMRILGENGLRPMTYKEIFVKLGMDRKLKGQLKDRGLFWIDGKGIDIEGLYTIQPDGSLKKGLSGDREKNVLVTSGSLPLTLKVGSNEETVSVWRRFQLDACANPLITASLVVGVPITMPINSIC